ncbi:hypothetical protein D9611_005624 [Ephemerocybe angulata]|uniref:ZZ-type domain-containing protein n=1 Tax=Ephemerocybe angulata TaxID=980116 RepID=A0A8H5BHK0_9AGAR|nr:hypothetical protein D9611_005624 [Tulosesus angulatus]
MFTVKATYRGETRKLSFPYTSSFPTFTELCNQLYRVFPINNSYYLTRLLYSPNANNPARILLASEVHNQDQYEDAVKGLSGRVYPNALLRFSVFDDTPHKQPNQGFASNSSLSNATQPIPSSSSQGHHHESTDGDKRPIVPPKPAELFSLPFEYISSLSGRSPSTISRASSLRSVSVAMDVDSTHPSQPLSQAQESVGKQAEVSAPTSSNASMISNSPSGSCCSPADVKEEIKALICGFERDVNRTLEKGFGSPTAPQVSIAFSQSKVPKKKESKVDLSALFAEGSFPASGPARRGSIKSGCTRGASTRSSRRPASGCLNATPTQAGRPLPQVPEQVVHNNVVCDSCEKTIVGIRHKCLDCPDYDLCTPCIKEDMAAEKHNPFHEFFEIHEPGRVIVHTVFDGNRRAPSSAAEASAATPFIHCATCDLCESSIAGTRYKCCDCPDFDTCERCFQITPEQHPKHSFVKMEKDQLIRRDPVHRKAHFARCDACSKTIHGVRYKCMHPDCPDFDLCNRCEAMPIPVHPESHPLLKIRNPDVVIPTVYRVGGTVMITPNAEEVPAASRSQEYGAGYRPAYAPRDGYNPSYLKSQTCMSIPIAMPCPVPAQEQEDDSLDEERAVTPRPSKDNEMDERVHAPLIDFVTHAEEVHAEEEDVDARNPFADPEPAPMIAPINGLSGSMASSFAASLEDRLNGLNAVKQSSPLTEAAEKEKSLFEGFLDRPKSSSEAGETTKEEVKKELAPSFVNDVLEDFFKSVGKPYVRREEPVASAAGTPKEDDDNESLSSLVSGVRSLVSLASGNPVSVYENIEADVKALKKEEEEEVAEAVLVEAPKVDPVPEVKEEVPSPTLAAAFISDVTVPDGQVFPPGAEFMKCWRMVNDGNVDWPESTEVVFVAGQPGLVARGSEAVKVGVVKVGEQVDVWTGELKAPEGVGRYVGYWRLRNGDTKAVFGNSIWVEIEVAEADHMSDETGSMSGSSIVMMPTALNGEMASAASSVRPESLTLTIPSSSSTTTDGESDIGSEGSLIDYMSDGEEVNWEDARSRADASSVAPSATVPVAPGSPVGEDFELVYDSSSDM